MASDLGIFQELDGFHYSPKPQIGPWNGWKRRGSTVDLVDFKDDSRGLKLMKTAGICMDIRMDLYDLVKSFHS